MDEYYCPRCNEIVMGENSSIPTVELTCPNCGNKFHNRVDMKFDWSKDWPEDEPDGQEES